MIDAQYPVTTPARPGPYGGRHTEQRGTHQGCLNRAETYVKGNARASQDDADRPTQMADTRQFRQDRGLEIGA